MPAVDAPFQQAIDELRAADGIVIDLRGNPGGLAAMMMGISGHFVTDRQPLGVMKTRDSELKFAANPAPGQRRRDAGRSPSRARSRFSWTRLSGSATECFTGGMQSIKRARVFGQTSMGQALPALFDKLPNGDLLIHAYGDFVTADGTRLEGRGVVPDEIVPLKRDGPACRPRRTARGGARMDRSEPAAGRRRTALRQTVVAGILLRGRRRLC